MTEEREYCWNCGKELGDQRVVVIHEYTFLTSNIVRPTCGPSCARKACVWRGTRHKDYDQQ